MKIDALLQQARMPIMCPPVVPVPLAPGLAFNAGVSPSVMEHAHEFSLPVDLSVSVPSSDHQQAATVPSASQPASQQAQACSG
jgi:hypothetical protein